MKKIVIVSDFFAPANSIGAIRLTKIAKYLHQIYKCEVMVITRDKRYEIIDNILEEDASFIKDYIKISEAKILLKIMELRQEKANAKFKISSTTKLETSTKVMKRSDRWISNFVRKILELINNYSYYFQAIKALKAKSPDYDIILSSFSPLSNHLIGRRMKKMNPSAIWIADFRDPVNNKQTPFGLKNYHKNFVKRICKTADSITAVSEGCMDLLFIPKIMKTQLITNGYDKDDICKMANDEKVNKTIKFLYIGDLYEGKRDLRVVFKAIRELIDENLILEEKLEFIYAGPSIEEFAMQINQFGLFNRAFINGNVPRKKSLEMQMKSDILLLASWNEYGSTGVVTGKFFEYMMMAKPIICTIVGDLPNSVLKQMIGEARIGFCYEEAVGELDYKLLKGYILEKYYEIIKEGEAKINPNYNYIEKFDYKNITNQFASLMGL